MEKKNIRNTSPEELADFLTSHGEKSFRTKQINQWIWQKGVHSFEEMSNLSKTTRELLESAFYFDTLRAERVQTATDGTTKTAWKLHDGLYIESVLIPGKDKFTVCVSSQVGCQLGCRFCATGTLGFKRNLSPGEIFDQVLFARQNAAERGSSLSNIVFMGMGEPLYNYDNVLTAIQKITDENGLAMSPYRITVSTAGIPEKIRQLADDDVRFNLAVSLHAAKSETRSRLMPVNQAYPLEQLAESLKYFVQKTGTRPTFEYLLIAGINDSLDDAQSLAAYCKQFPIKINLIEYNNVEGSAFKRSPDKQRDAFVHFLESRNMIVNVRRSKGKDIDAACGQLANKQKKEI
ncbi:23S rRNA (adenine(2503)-C(2))-methyltransferase RlmN [Odoribacter lunatus]|uniref:23S rRNA (adenine(2503)-C(2))-methyltransferase RlmN n=1 Tax=Odoribacter lunatus TaxID=2941335 RepID=UPI002041B1D4|nr:23S rRNA (adenine(2503)-C(2))-methyltransferase RlmN [Odoribacter lunatus]